jgi:uncharacterized membrane protein
VNRYYAHGLLRFILAIGLILKYNPDPFSGVWIVAVILMAAGYLQIVLGIEHKEVKGE